MEDHPATSAWLALSAGNKSPSHISTLKEKQGSSSVYRIENERYFSGPIIAKRCPVETATIERIIYEEILPGISVQQPRYYGSTPDTDSAWYWLFLEDVGGQGLNVTDPAHRDLAARWLAVFHTSTVNSELHVSIPSRGPDFYLGLLRKARHTIRTNLSNPSLREEQLSILDKVLWKFDILEANWDLVNAFSGHLPNCIFHGDFVSKNVRVCKQREISKLYPFDWESAGYGVPAQDLDKVNIKTYSSVVHEAWPFFNLSTARQIVSLGKVYWILRLLDWASDKLCYQWIDSVMSNEITFYNQEFDVALNQFIWQGKH